jgi:hypothetical protein
MRTDLEKKHVYYTESASHADLVEAVRLTVEGLKAKGHEVLRVIVEPDILKQELWRARAESVVYPVEEREA